MPPTTTTETLQGAAFGRFVRARRRELGVRQEDVAQAMGIATPRVSIIEGGAMRRMPHPAQVQALAALLEVDTVTLLRAAGYLVPTGDELGDMVAAHGYAHPNGGQS